MNTNHHLTLHLRRLKPTQAWTDEAEGLHFLFLTGGTAVCAWGHSSQRLGSGDVLVLRGGTGCRLSPANGSDIVFWSFSANLEHLFPLCGPAELGLVQSVMDGFRSPKHYYAANPATGHWHRLVHDTPPQFSLEHRGQLLRVAGAVLSEELKTLRAPAGRYVSAAESATTALEQLSADEILSLSVPELAARFHCCPRQLNRIFHAHFGLPVGALRMEMRLLKAVSLLRNRDYKVCHVAEQCGFSHLGLFSICFRRRFGASPSQWRKTFVESESPPPKFVEADPSCRLLANGLCPWSDATGKSKPVSDLARKSLIRGPKSAVRAPWPVVPGDASVTRNQLSLVSNP